MSASSGLCTGSRDIANVKRASDEGHSQHQQVTAQWRQHQTTELTPCISYSCLANLQTMRHYRDGLFHNLLKMH